MSESLRMRVVEAGARALDGRPSADLDGAAAAVLDAMLDCLAEYADEWRKLGWRNPDGSVRNAALGRQPLVDLLNVLREDR